MADAKNAFAKRKIYPELSEDIGTLLGEQFGYCESVKDEDIQTAEMLIAVTKRLNPDSPHPYCNEALMYFYRGDIDRAKIAFEQCVLHETPDDYTYSARFLELILEANDYSLTGNQREVVEHGFNLIDLQASKIGTELRQAYERS